jgi:hypothetical protein
MFRYDTATPVYQEVVDFMNEKRAFIKRHPAYWRDVELLIRTVVAHKGSNLTINSSLENMHQHIRGDNFCALCWQNFLHALERSIKAVHHGQKVI